ncbi:MULTISPECIES: nuclear transport factor 2 family protein [Xanthomonas]|uniref:Nuclear transport factor 2 family protein n=1 Tax=Xanthomonas cucurbitae TaxID=56453 RepID=A0ABY7YE78_9XANT|nr:nuclear transport factor 2 family protein [Xanthomonas cucurbitae]QHG88431.1 nuclear transport factor 2 family protein [Xanthomonas cucurbitae]WDM68192.1 nuclear transport factor 2 family protein [Xanthomonas cucurbitae]WDM72066.1 nuclear transport factor 2 family protein [Xanthomonas cucurbitae]WDM75004.1 nuclear transport factor 2 family protein [Xanthomonas cucurbitae]
MNSKPQKIRSLLLAALSLFCLQASAEELAGNTGADLRSTIAALDREVFDSFNRCADPAQLQKHAGYFDPAVEFYHDTGGVTWNRNAMLANTREHACGHYTRELIPETLKVYPVRDFGAISQGQHRFCDTATGKCEGLADFVMVWHVHDGQWTITRVLSYAHRSAAND